MLNVEKGNCENATYQYVSQKYPASLDVTNGMHGKTRSPTSEVEAAKNWVVSARKYDLVELARISFML